MDDAAVAKKVRDLVKELNRSAHEAFIIGVEVEYDIMENCSMYGNVPVIQVKTSRVLR